MDDAKTAERLCVAARPDRRRREPRLAALKARYSAVPWRQISDFRNVLAHGYTDIRLDRVWRASAVDLPALKAVVHEELGRASSP
jgi:uncharacterized protein with HEPN domain